MKINFKEIAKKVEAKRAKMSIAQKAKECLDTQKKAWGKMNKQYRYFKEQEK